MLIQHIILYNELKSRGIDSFECVTGDSEDPTSYANRFSPIVMKLLE